MSFDPLPVASQLGMGIRHRTFQGTLKFLGRSKVEVFIFHFACGVAWLVEVGCRFNSSQ